MSTDILIADIRTDGGTQMRAQIDLATIAEYTDALERGDVFPPVMVFYDGADYWLAEGFHRLAAHRHLERETIAADVKPGTREDAVIAACAANATHGLRRTNADKRTAVETMLKMRTEMRNEDIAAHCGVSLQTVYNRRAELEAAFKIRKLDARVGADGKEYPTTYAKPTEPAPQPTYEPVAAWPMMPVGEPSPEAETEQEDDEQDEGEMVTISRNDLARYQNTERFAGLHDYYGEDSELNPAWKQAEDAARIQAEEDENEDEDTPAFTPHPPFIPLTTRPPMPAEPEAQWSDHVDEVFANTPQARAEPLISLLVKLGAYRQVDDAVMAAWLECTRPVGRAAGRDTLIALNKWAEHMLSLINQHERTGLRIVGKE